MTKAERIRALKKARPGLNSFEIARRVGCNAGYVRAALAREMWGGLSPSEIEYRRKWSKKHGLAYGGPAFKRVREASHA